MSKRTSSDDMKIKNCISLIKYVIDNPGINRKRISILSGLSNQTVTNLMKELIEDGVIREFEIETSGQGRPPVGLKFCYDSIFIISIEITYNLVTFYLHDLSGKVIESFSKELFYKCDIKNILLENTKALLNSNNVVVNAIVINAEGVSIESENTIKFVKSLGIQDFNIRLALKELHIPLWLVNDVNLINFDAVDFDFQLQNFLTVKYASGLGSSTVINRKISKTGLHNMPGKFSHIKVYGTDEHNKCWCGGENCLATFIAKDGVEARLKLPFEQVINEVACNKRDDFRSFMEKILSQTLSNYVILLGIEKIYFCGETSDKLGSSFFKEVDNKIKQELPPWISYKGIELIKIKSCPHLSSKFYIKYIIDHPFDYIDTKDEAEGQF